MRGSEVYSTRKKIKSCIEHLFRLKEYLTSEDKEALYTLLDLIDE